MKVQFNKAKQTLCSTFSQKEGSLGRVVRLPKFIPWCLNKKQTRECQTYSTRQKTLQTIAGQESVCKNLLARTIDYSCREGFESSNCKVETPYT